MFQDKIVSLKAGIINYAELVEKMIVHSIEGTVNRSESILQEVIGKDEALANRYELEFDEICTNYIAQYQPVTKNLRMLISAIKMSNDLERMADHAVNISQSGLFLIGQPFIKPFVDIPKMSEITLNMLRDSIKSFVSEDIELARKVLKADSDVDNLKIRVMEDVTVFMERDKETIGRALKLINIASNLERIADLSTNICEDIIYIAEGMVVKHHNAENV